MKILGTEARWVIVHQTESGVYVFPCASDADGSATGDDWYETISDAYMACAETYGIEQDDWITIDDPQTDCQQDWISPVRVRGRESGSPRWGEFERLIDGNWVPIDPAHPGTTIEEAIQRSDPRNDPDGAR